MIAKGENQSNEDKRIDEKGKRRIRDLNGSEESKPMVQERREICKMCASCGWELTEIWTYRKERFCGEVGWVRPEVEETD